MTKFTSTKSYGSLNDNDSGIGLDKDYSSSSDLRSSTTTLIEPTVKIIPFPFPDAIARKRINQKPLIKFPSDGIIQRVRPITLKNSENGDFIICQTNRGAYIAQRTPLVPQWVTELVRDIESREK